MQERKKLPRPIGKTKFQTGRTILGEESYRAENQNIAVEARIEKATATWEMSSARSSAQRHLTAGRNIVMGLTDQRRDFIWDTRERHPKRHTLKDGYPHVQASARYDESPMAARRPVQGGTCATGHGKINNGIMDQQDTSNDDAREDKRNQNYTPTRLRRNDDAGAQDTRTVAEKEPHSPRTRRIAEN